MSRLTALRILATSLLTLGLGARAGAAPEVAEPGEVLNLASALLRGHGYLLEDDTRARLDALHRDGREGGRQMREGKDDQAKQKGAEKRAAAAEGIIALFDTYPGLIRRELREGHEVLPPLDPIHLRATTDAILIRTEIQPSGDSAAVHATVNEQDFSNMPNEWQVGPIDVSNDGVSFILLTLRNVPKGTIDQRMDIRAGNRVFRQMIQFRTPPPGRLKMTVVAETGQPIPAMVRLVRKLTGQTQRPSNAVPIEGQFDTQGRRTSERELIVPTPTKGSYYCMPEPVNMEAPAGEWQVIIRHGIEYLPVTDSFTIEPGQTTEETYTMRRWVDMRKLGWYSGDDHAHCRILSDDDADCLMAYAKAEDVHLVNVVKMGDIFRTWFEQRGFGPDYRVIDGDYVLSPGQECPRTHQQLGHTISMNTKRMVRDTEQYYLYDRVFDQVHAMGGLSGYAHVNSNMFHVHRDMAINIPKRKIDFVEVLQFAHLGVDVWYRFLNAGFKVTASAGSDIPWGGTMGEVRVYAHVGDQPFTADAWFEALRRGRTFVTNGPMLEFKVDDAMPGDELVVKEDRKLHVKARAWGDPGFILPAKLVIVQQGDEVKVVESSDNQQRELSVEMDIDAGPGFWIAAHAVGTNGEHAHTTPVYVTRPGLRFWKHQDADRLIDQATRSLDEVEKIVADAREKDRQGQLEDDRTLKQLALQGAELLERVADARKIWQDLREVAAKEAPIRAKLSGGK
ncbi:MAG: CehA/McbA family metallohydrolase [Planctomycetes bacterium]|nr:CehA/McbA family metallohydrolase [Planctomycetota bacterium]